MKISMVIFLLSLSLSSAAQSEITGVYRNYFRSEIRLNTDNTFLYDWYTDLHGAWAKGKWEVRNDTVYFHMIPMYDTLSTTGSNGKRADTLLLSQYSNPRRLTTEMLSEVTVGEIKQNGDFLPDIMLFKENRLYEVKNGKLVTEKKPGGRGVEHDPWYFKFANE